MRSPIKKLFVVLALIAGVFHLDAGTVTLAWNPSADTNVIGYKIYFGTTSQDYTTNITIGNVASATINGLTDGTTYYFAATSYNATGDESVLSNEASYAVPQTTTNGLPVANQPPTLAPIASLAINENAGQQTISLSGITSGATNENQTLTVTAVSSNPALIPTPMVNYTSANTTGTLTFAPAFDAYGTATITVTVNDGGTSNNIVSQSFTVTVNAVNQSPTLNSIASLAINENAGSQSVNLSGISSGAANENQTLTVTAVSSNPTLIPAPAVNYTSPNPTGTLTFAPSPDATGTATITVTVNDGGASNNLVSQSFTVTVNAVNQPPTLNPISSLVINENLGTQIINLSGISSGATNENQTLTVTAISSDPTLIPAPVVHYTSPNTTGTLTFATAWNACGTATITVTVNDGGAGGNTVSQTFTVTANAVNQPPTMDPIMDGTASVTWNPNPNTNVIGYTIYYGTASHAYATNIAVGNVTNTTINGLAEGTTYYFAATSRDAAGTESLFSDETSFTVPLTNTLTLNENAGSQTVNLSGITSGATNENQTLTVTAVSSNPALIPAPVVNYSSADTNGTLTYVPAPDASGSAIITVTVDDGGASNNIVSQSFIVTVNAVNQPPTLNPIANLAINENDGTQTVNLSGISSGATNENQTLAVTAVSSNPALIPAPVVNYTSPNSTGTLTFAPAPNASGTATITVTVNDGGASDNVVSQSFTVTVNAVNQLPTLNPIGSLVMDENAGPQTVNLSGITSGATNENQTLTVTAVSSNPALISTPVVNYTSPNATGTLTFAPALNAYGTATITVTVNDGSASDNIVSQSFTVTVNAVNQPPTLNPIANLAINENAGTQTVNLSGISSGATNENQTLTVTAVSSNPALISTPVVNYTSANSTGTLTFAPALNANGTATITVTVNDGGASDNVVSQSFTVTVNAVNQAPTLNSIADLTINENTNQQTVLLTGITSGATNEFQTLQISAVSSNKRLARPSISYTSPDTTGTLSFTPGNNAYGVATVTVTVDDGGASNNIVTKSFVLTVLSPAQAAAVASANVSGNAAAILIPQPITPSGEFGLTLAGRSGSPYVVESSPDLTHWISVETNTSPFTMMDTNAAALPQQYYRAYLLQ